MKRSMYTLNLIIPMFVNLISLLTPIIAMQQATLATGDKMVQVSLCKIASTIGIAIRPFRVKQLLSMWMA